MTRYTFLLCVFVFFAFVFFFLVVVARREKGRSLPCCFWVLFVVPFVLLLLSAPHHVNVAFGLLCHVVAFGPPHHVVVAFGPPHHVVVVFGHYLSCYSCCLHEVELFLAQGGNYCWCKVDFDIL